MHHRRPKIAFVSPHCLVDFTNGAATATRDGLKLLAAQGFECLAFCGTRLDEARRTDPRTILPARGQVSGP